MDLQIDKRETWFGETAWCCDFEHKSKKYYADLTPMPKYCRSLYSSECMIFDQTKATAVHLGECVYVRQSIPVTKEALVECIEEFIAEREKEST